MGDYSSPTPTYCNLQEILYGDDVHSWRNFRSCVSAIESYGNYNLGTRPRTPKLSPLHLFAYGGLYNLLSLRVIFVIFSFSDDLFNFVIYIKGKQLIKGSRNRIGLERGCAYAIGLFRFDSPWSPIFFLCLHLYLLPSFTKEVKLNFGHVGKWYRLIFWWCFGVRVSVTCDNLSFLSHLRFRSKLSWGLVRFLLYLPTFTLEI